MNSQDEKDNKNEQGLLPYLVIEAVVQGDPEAMWIVLHHYESYIISLSIRRFRDNRGNIYYGVDRDIYDRLRTKLMQAVLKFKI